MGARVPAGRPDDRHRAARAHSHHRSGRVSARRSKACRAVWLVQDGGLLDVGVHPDFAKNGWIYLAFSETGRHQPGASTTRIIRARIRNDRLVDQETLFQAPQALYWPDNTHFGARFLFDKRGHVFYSIGDRGHDTDAQDLGEPIRQAAPHQRRWHGAGGQPVRRSRRRGEDDLELRPSQPAGTGLAPGDRRALVHASTARAAATS